jgi:hypothetical protein
MIFLGPMLLHANTQAYGSSDILMKMLLKFELLPYLMQRTCAFKWKREEQ